MDKAKEIILQAVRKMEVAGNRKIEEGKKLLKQAKDLKEEINK